MSRRYYSAGPVTVGEVALADKIEQDIGDANKRRRANASLFREFCKENDLREEATRTLSLFIGALLSARQRTKAGKTVRYKKSSVLTMVKDVRWSIRRKHARVTAGDLERWLEVQDAQEIATPAPDVPVRDIVTKLRTLPAGPIRTRSFEMVLTGLRNSDLNNNPIINRLQDCVALKVNLSKNRRKKKFGINLTLEDSWSFWWLLDTNAKDGVRRHDAATPKVETTDLCKQLKMLGMTSYTLRRCYIHQVIAMYTRDDGFIDKEAVKQKTLHIDAKTIDAFYNRVDGNWKPTFVKPHSW
jgi:hypothetical protein